jgi:DNA replication and repair protein RecF
VSDASVALRRLWLTDFRSYATADVAFSPGVTVLVGRNGQGKTNVLEAISYAGSQASFRGASPETMVRAGCDRAVVRAEVERDGRDLLLEAELAAFGRGRMLVNKQRMSRRRDMLGLLPTTVFTPDDLVLVKGGPAERRRYLDESLVQLRPSNDALRSEVDRVLRQRNTLLKQAGGRLTDEIASTLDVWDAKFADAGQRLAEARVALVGRLEPVVVEAAAQLSGSTARASKCDVALDYEAAWLGDGLAETLARGRDADVRRGVTLVGPHRDELILLLDGRPARTQASQGEQRTVALALRLAAHRLAADHLGVAPLLLLDDVFSELDPSRSEALLEHLPPGQTILTTAGAVPAAAHPDVVLEVVASTISRPSVPSPHGADRDAAGA